MQILRPRSPRRVQGIHWTNAATIKITHVLILLTLIEYGGTNITGLRTHTIRLFDTRVYIASLHVSDLKTQSWDSDIYNSIIISWRHCYIDMTLCYVRLDKCITCRHSIKPNAQWWCHQNTPAYRLPDVTGWGSTKFSINRSFCITHICICPQFVIFMWLKKSHFDVISPLILTQSLSNYPSTIELGISDERHAWSSSDRCIMNIIKGFSHGLIIKITINVSLNLMTIWLEGYMIIWSRFYSPVMLGWCGV